MIFIFRVTLLLILNMTISCSPLQPNQKNNNKKAFGPEVIYGKDDRIDFFAITDPFWQIAAGATVAVMDKRKLTLNVTTQTFEVSSKTYGPVFSLCTDEAFYSQPTAAFCSGFLIGPDIVVTAGHCIRSQLGCENARFVFNYSYREKNSDLNRIPSSDVYDCKELIHSQANSISRADYAVLRLDRVVTGHPPLLVRTHDKIKDDQQLTVIGYPSGLPGKLADDGIVRSNDQPGYFVTTLDTYGGNSGSAVLDSNTGLVEGILVRGDTDFVYDQQSQCRRSNVCKDSECRGEEVTRIQFVLEHLSPKDLSPRATDLIK